MFDKLIVITAPEFFDAESKILNQLFEAGLTRLHIRKPQSKREELRRLVNEIDVTFRRFISIHYHPDLLSEMELGGLHFSFPEILNQAKLSDKYTASCSLHGWEELMKVKEMIDYCFMSPVFNSISKIGYHVNDALKHVPAFARNVYALGGITAANCDEALNNGYSGIAVLGYLWEDKNHVLQRFSDLQEKLKAYGT